jgi:hypothetical protein
MRLATHDLFSKQSQLAGPVQVPLSIGLTPLVTASQEWRCGHRPSQATEELKWCSREDSHLELPLSQSGVQDSYTSGAISNLRHAGTAPAPAVWKTAVLTVTPMTLWKVVAASGIAPDSPRLQRGANLSQLRSHGPSARYCAAVFRLSGGGSAFELRRNEMVARGGNAPPSTGCKPAALLLSYRANEREWHPHSVMLRGLLIENQPCCYCTMRASSRVPSLGGWTRLLSRDLHVPRPEWAFLAPAA